MAVFSHREFAGHEQVVFARDEDSGLRAIIAIHNTARGPGARWLSHVGLRYRSGGAHRCAAPLRRDEL